MAMVVCECCNELTNRCVFCNSDELVWGNSVSDWKCQDCGKWEQGE